MSGDVLQPGVFDAVGLSAGQHIYKIVPENSRGKGPASDFATIAVNLAQVA
ncbi:MAG: hypothetical protein HY043_14335 [Verrucomicrobia bacterium]|nr:hypothetical protein [Verrucomicrobiota bacterium]